MSGGARVLTTGDRLRKLRAMSFAEVKWRLQYKTSLQLDRWRHKRGSLAPPQPLQELLVPALRGGAWRSRLLASRSTAPVRFFAGVHDRDAMRSLFASRYASERAKALRYAADARSHRFQFFGAEFACGADIAWQADPVSGRSWPSVFHADVPVHGGDIGFGDVKHVWELSRQQYLIDLGKAEFLIGDTASLAALRDLVRSWIRGNPYGTGVNWSCALEPAFRALSWLWAYFLTLPSLDEEFHFEWLRGFHDHAHFLERHLEQYSSPYNHLIGEAATLFMIGANFPEFAGAERWRDRGRAVLESHLDEQFYPDGGSVEQSTFYHHATLGFYLLAALTARHIDADLSTRVWSAIERALDFSLHIVQPDGRIPEIGGADDGKPIRLEHLPFWDFRPYLGVGAVLFRRADFKFAATRFHEDALWLLGPVGLAAFDALDAVAPGKSSTELPQSGYSILRSDWSSQADYVCVDCGEQAAGMRTDAVANSMHGHADCLSVVAWLHGRRVLVDSGLFSYNCGGEWEAHFRETAAHNTARVGGRDQARHIGKMAWSHCYRARREAFHADSEQAWTLGSHDGFARGPEPVTHRRAVWLRSGGCLVIVDEFVGSGAHDLEVIFQFAPGTLRQSDGAAIFDDVEIVWSGTTEWTPSTACGGTDPDEGWIAPSLGVRQAAPRLTLRSRSAAARTILLTVLARRNSLEKRATAIQVSDSMSIPVIAIRDNGWTDWICVPDGRTGPIVSDSLVCACRVTRTELLSSDRILGTYVNADLGRLADKEGALSRSAMS